MKILSFYKSNIDRRIVHVQKRIFNQFGYYIQQVKNDRIGHADFIDREVWKADADLLFVDIDCFPLKKEAVSVLLQFHFAGNVQRSNHIENRKHLFVAPSCMYMSNYVVKRLQDNRITAQPTVSGDVGENITYFLEHIAIKPHFFYPTRFLKKPLDGKEQWDLNEFLKPFGRFCYFGDIATGEEFWFHAFQVRAAQDIEEYLAIARGVLG